MKVSSVSDYSFVPSQDPSVSKCSTRDGYDDSGGGGDVFTIFDGTTTLPQDNTKDEPELKFSAPKANGGISGVAVNNDKNGEMQGSANSVAYSSTNSRTMDSVARRGRLFAKRQQRRLVFKDGECNISKNQINDRKQRFFRDIFTTLLEMKWRYNLMMFGCVFLTSWLVFALLWWILCVAHGDHLLDDNGDEEPSRCVANVYSFPTALLFSIETQHTIGYGSRMIETKCPEAFFLLMLQSCIGVFIQSLLTGVIFAKLSRPKHRTKTLMFSKNAVICQRDDNLLLLIRFGDMRKSPIIQTNIRAVMVKSRLTKEGELIPLCQYPLHLETETSTATAENFVFLSWPITVVHRINSESPLWEMSLEEMLEDQFEVVVILEGTIENTGMLAQMRTSYLPGEILWGHRFAPLFAFWKDKGQYQVDFTQFDATIPTDTPECSAKDLAERKLQQSHQHSLSKEEALLMSNFLTIPSSVNQNQNSTSSTSPNTSIFKRMRSSLKRRRSDRERRRNGSLPSISFNGSIFDDLKTIAANAKLRGEEEEVDVDVSVESSCATETDLVNSNSDR